MPSRLTFESGSQYQINDDFMISGVPFTPLEDFTAIFIGLEEPMMERLLQAFKHASSNRKEVLYNFINSQPWRTEKTERVPFDPLEFSFAFAGKDWLLFYGIAQEGASLPESWRVFALFDLVEALIMQVRSWAGELHRDHLYHQFRVAWLCKGLFDSLVSDELWDTLDSIVVDSLSAKTEEIIKKRVAIGSLSQEIAVPRLNGHSLKQYIGRYKESCWEWRRDNRHPAFDAGLFHDIGILIKMFPRLISELLSPIVIRVPLGLSTSKDVKSLLLFLAHDEMMGYWRVLYPQYAQMPGVRNWIKNRLLDESDLNSLNAEAYRDRPSDILATLAKESPPTLSDRELYESPDSKECPERRCYEVFDSFVGSFRRTILSHDYPSIDKTLLKELENAVNNRDHGVLSALVIADFLLPSSTRAIAFHNDETIDIWFPRFPVAFLLVLADELQEWQRPWMKNDGRYIYALDAIDLKLSCKSGNRASLRNPPSLEVKMDYSIRAQELGSTDFDFVKLYKSKCKNLGRLISLRQENKVFPQLTITMIGPEGEEFAISTCINCGRQAPSHEILREEGKINTQRRAKCLYCDAVF